MKYVLSYYQRIDNQWVYDAHIVEADRPEDITIPNDVLLYMVQVETYSPRPLPMPYREEIRLCQEYFSANKCKKVVVTDLAKKP